MPEVTVGPPSSARAYPSATTLCPSCRASESPRPTVGRPVAPIFSTARSCRQSPPITRASYVFGFLSDVKTVIFVASSTTWQFVTMTPSERTTKPVPTPLPCWPPRRMSEVTFTTAGSTRCTTWTTDPPPGGTGAGDDDSDRIDALSAVAPFVPKLTEHAVAARASTTEGMRSLRMWGTSRDIRVGSRP